MQVFLPFGPKGGGGAFALSAPPATPLYLGKLGFICYAKPEGFTQATAGLVKPVSPKGKMWSWVLLLEALQFNIKISLNLEKKGAKMNFVPLFSM